MSELSHFGGEAVLRCLRRVQKLISSIPAPQTAVTSELVHVYSYRVTSLSEYCLSIYNIFIRIMFNSAPILYKMIMLHIPLLDSEDTATVDLTPSGHGMNQTHTARR